MTCFFLFRRFLLLATLVAASVSATPAAETSQPSSPPTRLEETNSQETLRAYLQLQEQIHAAQLAIEQNRKDMRDANSQATEALASRLQAIEQALAAQRAKELEAMQSSNRVMLIVAGSFAIVGFVAMLIMAYFQWRTVHGLAEISTVLPISRALGPGPSLPALGPGDGQVISVSPAEQSNLRLLTALEQLEKRIHELEHTSHPPSLDGAKPENGIHDASTQPNGKAGNGTTESTSPEAAVIATLLGKGQSMLNLDNPQAALACFDEALALAPKHAEALVRKATALERLQKLEEALECYDQAIAADSSLTIAYLQKGGVYNRLERFSDALACYEQALRTQEKRDQKNASKG